MSVLAEIAECSMLFGKGSLLVRWDLGRSTNFFLYNPEPTRKDEMPRILSRVMVGILLDHALLSDERTTALTVEAWMSKDGTFTVWQHDAEKPLYPSEES